MTSNDSGVPETTGTEDHDEMAEKTDNEPIEKAVSIPKCLEVDRRNPRSLELSRNLTEVFVRVVCRSELCHTFEEYYQITGLLRQDSKNIYIAQCLRTQRTVIVKSLCKNVVKNVLVVEGAAIPMELIVQMHATKYVPQQIQPIIDYFEDETRWLLVMPYSPYLMDLYDYLNDDIEMPAFNDNSSCSNRSVKMLPADMCKYVFKQLVKISNDLMNIGIVHRDLKIENILVNAMTMQISLIDFGASAIAQDRDYTDFHGTLAYRTPEFILRHGYSAGPSTVWMLGLVLFDLLNGYLPFKREEDIIAGRLVYREGISAAVREFISSCLCVDPNQRLDLEALVKHSLL